MNVVSDLMQSGTKCDPNRHAASTWLAALIAITIGIVILTLNHSQVWNRHETDGELDHFFRATAVVQLFVRIWLVILLASSASIVFVRNRLIRIGAACLAIVAATGFAYNATLAFGTM